MFEAFIYVGGCCVPTVAYYIHQIRGNTEPPCSGAHDLKTAHDMESQTALAKVGNEEISWDVHPDEDGTDFNVWVRR
jgi:hypothetical protein